MKVLLFNGSAMPLHPHSTSVAIQTYLRDKLEASGCEVSEVNILEGDVPFFSSPAETLSPAVELFLAKFRQADAHIWLSPLYHGGIPGRMKNHLDWLETTARSEEPYLTNKKIGMVCWADGGFALHGILAMEAIAKALRAWTIPYSVPLSRRNLFEPEQPGRLTCETEERLNRLLGILLQGVSLQKQ